ncbi:hypothetical protein [Mycoplasma sp. P36-A1]|uniref:hypothetical protein n=1 Tax=Mycoplasma sp. P36-A1 TaxID=3252900 RepID=UPI003C30345F
MKKILLLLTVFILSITIVGCSQDNSLGYETLKNQDHIIKEIDYNQLKEKQDNKESFYLMIGRPSCSHCVDTILEYSNIAKEHNIKEVYYYSFEEIAQKTMNNQALSEDENKQYDYLKEQLKFEGATPAFYYIKEGKLALSTDDIDTSNLTTWSEVLNKFFDETIK